MSHGKLAVMRIAILSSGLLLSALGLLALRILPKDDAIAFFQGALTLGGGWLICFGFSFRMHWHGIIGAGVLALLGLAKGFGNLPDLMPPSSPGAKAWMELCVTVVSALLLGRVIALLMNERSRRLRENMNNDHENHA